MEEYYYDDDIFKAIVDYEDIKELFLDAVFAKAIVHILLVGKPATAKSLFLEEFYYNVPHCYCSWVTGSKASKAGIINEILFTYSPKYLLIDEIDKLGYENFPALLDLMETGWIVETKYHRRREAKLDCKVFATANRTRDMPEELLSRFLMLYFREYSDEEYLQITTSVLTKREQVDEDLAFYIAKKTLKWKDYRIARSIARICWVKEDVDKKIKTMEKYSLRLNRP